MTVPSNQLQQVITYQKEELGYFQNNTCLLNLADTKYKDFNESKEANLGDTISFSLPPFSVGSVGLVANFQATQERLQTLVCDQAFNVARAFTAQDFIFNAEKFMDQFGMADVEELGSKVEINLGLNIISAVPVMTVNSEGQSVPTGELHTESGPYRFANFLSGLNSYQQLQQVVTNFGNAGLSKSGLRMVLPDTVVPAIVGTGLNQFAPKRNDEIAMSWELGEFGTPRVQYYASNLLPTHIAGTLGNEQTELTVVSINAAGTQIVCSGAGTDSEAVFSGDLGQFEDNVPNFTNLRFRTPRGHAVTSQPVQFRVTASAASSAGSVTLNITPALIATPGPTQNINVPVVAGMKIKLVPSHKAGVLLGAKSFYVAMPPLPDEDPFPTSNKMDKDTGVSMRLYYGTIFGRNTRGLIHDEMHGACMIPEDCLRVLLPV
jgi:hypothetical protein